MKLRNVTLLAATLALTVVIAGCGGAKPAAPAAPAAAPAASAPAASAPAAGSFNQLVVNYDTVLGSKNVAPAESAAKVCVQRSRYARNEEIVWRIKVLDPKTGQFLDDKALKSVEVKLGDGKVLKASYAPHPKNTPTDNFWATAFEIPENYPTGTLNFDIQVAGNDGRNGKVLNFNVAPALLTVLDAAVPKVAPAAKK